MRFLLIFLLLTLAAPAQSTPESVVGRLYPWLLQVDARVQQRLSEVQDCLTPELYSQLTRAYTKDPNSGDFLDFDPWSDTQMGADDYHWGPTRMVGQLAKVPITVTVHGGGTQKYTCILTRSAGRWQVANLVYSSDFNLLSTLKALNGNP